MNAAPAHSPTGPPQRRSRPELPAWQALRQHAAEIQNATVRELFDSDPHRIRDFSVEDLGVYVDFSKHPITRETLRLLIELAEQCELWERIMQMVAGDKINVSEHRAALHTALRAPRGAAITVDGTNVVPQVHQVLDRMGAFADALRSGQWTGHTGQPIRAVVNIGIGGSDLGPRMAHQALRAFTDPGLRMEFVSNIDGAEFIAATGDLDPAQTLFVISSRSWHTRETLTNAATARDWLLAAFGGDTAAIARHFVAVSTNAGGVGEFGIDPANMFPFRDWVGRRYSFDAAVGLSLMIAIGASNFAAMLAGMHDVDEHFRTTPLQRNIPVLMGLLAVWYNNFRGAETQAVLPYSHDLALPPAYLQQLEMESNGKHVTLAGRHVDYHAGQVIWGQPGTNGQHAFYQLLHQGTKLIPCDFIGMLAPPSELDEQHDLLTANLFAQTEGLAFGRTAEQLRQALSPEAQIAHRVCEGNRPSTTLLLDELTPRGLGTLIALYEHMVFTEGAIWDVDSFDQRRHSRRLRVDVAALLGSEADSLLAHTCATIDRQALFLPGPEHPDQVMIDSDRPAPVLRNLAHLHNHGRRAGTGYLSILPADQGVEHSGAASFAVNPDYFDPHSLCRLAEEGGCNAIATTPGALGVISRRWAGWLPFIAKLNHNQLPSYPEQYRQTLFGSVQQAFDLGATGVGATIYFGSPDCNREIGQVAQLFAHAHRVGMFTVPWCYLRNPAFTADGINFEASTDLTGQASHLGITLHADLIKLKQPENNGGYTAVGFGRTDPLVYNRLTTGNPIDLTRWQVANCYLGRIGLINSGGASNGRDDLAQAVRTAVINKRADGTGLIVGRKSFRKSLADGVALLHAAQDVYLDPDITIA
ncbi:MAG: glucose-6-phosphate isomerase [Actinomycetota bacterium]|nr:glucose-6-phosphate isomerase [Actinomycetota bacterium]